MPDENTEVVVVGDTPEIEIADPPAAKDKPVPTSDAADAVEQLKRQLAERTEGEKAAREDADRARRAATEAEQRARDQAGHALAANRMAQGHELDAVANALGAAQREMEALESKLKEAMEAGEFGTVAKLQTEIGKQGARLVQLEDGKSILEARAKDPAPRPAPRSPEDQREDYLQSRTPATAAWLRANPRFFSDPRFRQKVESADGYVANILGVARDTPEYFAKIEETTGLKPPATSQAAATVDRVGEPAAKPKPAAASAPPSRSVPASPREGVASDGKVTLTREEYDAAQWLHPKLKADDPAPEVVYARNKLALQREGRLLGSDGRPMGPQNV